MSVWDVVGMEVWDQCEFGVGYGWARGGMGGMAAKTHGKPRDRPPFVSGQSGSAISKVMRGKIPCVGAAVTGRPAPLRADESGSLGDGYSR